MSKYPSINRTECEHCHEDDGPLCHAASPSGLGCRKQAGHAGPHVACYKEHHACETWESVKTLEELILAGYYKQHDLALLKLLRTLGMTRIQRQNAELEYAYWEQMTARLSNQVGWKKKLERAHNLRKL